MIEPMEKLVKYSALIVIGYSGSIFISKHILLLASNIFCLIWSLTFLKNIFITNFVPKTNYNHSKLDRKARREGFPGTVAKKELKTCIFCPL